MTTNWVKILAERYSDTVPEGWTTTKDIAAELGVHHDSVYKRLHRKLNLGMIERKRLTIDGKQVSIWRPVESPEKEKRPAKGP